LRPFHQAALAVVEGIAPVHGAAVVPHDQVAGVPAVGPDKTRMGGVGDEPVEKGAAFGFVHAPSPGGW